MVDMAELSIGDTAGAADPERSVLHLPVDALPIGILVLVDEAVVAANAEWSRISGVGAPDSLGNGWLTALHPGERRRARRFVLDSTRTETAYADFRCAGRGDFWFRVNARRFIGSAGELNILSFVSTQPPSDSPVAYLATHDSLTGLLNRVGLRQAMQLPRIAGDLASVLFVDLDHFKEVNDHHGHRYGDEVLKAACRRVRGVVRSTDFVGRVGGDEFCIYCPALKSPDEAIRLAERVIEAVHRPLALADRTVAVGTSIGIAFAQTDQLPSDRMSDQADIGMYAAKTAGGGRWAVFDREQDDQRDRGAATGG